MGQKPSKEATMRMLGTRFKQFTRVEKAFYTSIVLSGIFLAISTVFMQTKVLQIQSEMAKVNQNINQKQIEINDAKQAINELTRSARMMEIAEKAELTFNNDNIGVAE